MEAEGGAVVDAPRLPEGESSGGADAHAAAARELPPTPAEKFTNGTERRPGHTMPVAQPAAEQPAPLGAPALPAPQPTQEVEALSVPPDGASGASQTRGVQVDAPGAVSCSPAAHACGAATHWMGRIAPVPNVVVPSGHATQEVFDAPPATLLNRPSGQFVHTCEPGVAEKVPVGQIEHCVAPEFAAKVPGAQSEQAVAATAPLALLARPTGHAMHPSSVCPGAGLYVPATHAEQLDDAVAPRELP